MDSGDLKRITVFAGHYGSGKTNIAVNTALGIRVLGKKTAIADLDIVNPYFRTKDSAEILEKNGIRLISSQYANTNVDTPALPPEIYSVFEDKSTYAVIDVGGDDRGALALGRYVPFIKTEDNFDMIFVINKYRFLTRSPRETLGVMREIEDAANIRFTGIVNNSNLGEETDENTVLSSVSYAEETADLAGLCVKMTTVKKELYAPLKDKIENLRPIELFVRQSWLREGGV